MLKPINREWVAPSLLWGEVALCRDEKGDVWFCTMVNEAEGWQPEMIATDDVIRGFQMSQKLAGKDPQPWPK